MHNLCDKLYTVHPSRHNNPLDTAARICHGERFCHWHSLSICCCLKSTFGTMDHNLHRCHFGHSIPDHSCLHRDLHVSLEMGHCMFCSRFLKVHDTPSRNRGKLNKLNGSGSILVRKTPHIVLLSTGEIQHMSYTQTHWYKLHRFLYKLNTFSHPDRIRDRSCTRSAPSAASERHLGRCHSGQ